jgi:hypothetical protein
MRTLSLSEIHPDNYRLMVEKPDKDFSPDKNRAVLKQVLAENDKMQAELNDKVKENAGQTAEILSHFAKYKLDIGGGKQLEQYLGKSWMSKIYGEKLIEKIRMIDTIKKQNIAQGNTKFENFYLK